MRWATFQIPPAPAERIGVVRGDEIIYEVERLGRIANRIVAGPPLIPLRP